MGQSDQPTSLNSSDVWAIAAQLRAELANLYNQQAFVVEQSLPRLAAGCKAVQQILQTGIPDQYLCLDMTLDSRGLLEELLVGQPENWKNVCNWVIAKDETRPLPDAVSVFRVTFVPIASEPYQRRRNLHFNHPALNGRPGNDPATPSVMDDINHILQYWRRHSIAEASTR